MITLTLTPHLRMICAHAETLEIDMPSPDEFDDMKASAAEAHLHIDALHKVLKTVYVELPSSLEHSELGGKLRAAIDLMMDWEVDQCPF
ncbi:hypothetical protein Ssed_2190 [Shewanella sediminis HAW-EB3]|uniref:Uncharacterized protein n=1 Tax=Shewanella sediminis (strain HAW-EB3) TaxID=425104 RepID=A8FVC6_SHESH|nr:hypothetical protein [Shewanella sediminis]ABV36799.1 hypothetical protein Ssed_2190 [Shewanella sediminis HAW-EB3]